MPTSLPNECFRGVLSFLDRESLYKCLFVNRFYCKLSIPIIWRDPFFAPIDDTSELPVKGSFFDPRNNSKKFQLINTLLACLNEDEISSLIPCAININNQSPLFEYGKYVRKIVHGDFVSHIIGWLNPSNQKVPIDDQDCRVQKLTNAIYHMIMRKGSNLQKFVISNRDDRRYIVLPEFSIFTTYKPGITNLRSLNIDVDFGFGDKFQNTIEFLRMVSNFCNGIVNLKLWINSPNYSFLNFIKLQPLEKIRIHINYNLDIEDVKIIMYALEFRSETLKKLSFFHLDFQGIDLSFISKLKYLEYLEFQDCFGFTFYDTLSKEKLHLKELTLWYCEPEIDAINSLCSETLLKLSLTFATPEIIKLVKESCPNISSLCIKDSESSAIPIICELSSLRILDIELIEDSPVRILGDYLASVEYLLLPYYIDLPSFEYFTNNCKANLKKLIIYIDEKNSSLWEDYLTCVNNFQKVHNSLKVLGINQCNGWWTNKELEIIDSLKKQGIDIVVADDIEFFILMNLFM